MGGESQWIISVRSGRNQLRRRLGCLTVATTFPALSRQGMGGPDLFVTKRAYLHRSK